MNAAHSFDDLVDGVQRRAEDVFASAYVAGVRVTGIKVTRAEYEAVVRTSPLWRMPLSRSGWTVTIFGVPAIVREAQR